MTNINTILAVDCGTINTKAALIDQVDGVYRLVARGAALSSHHSPWNDITIGITDAMKQIEAKTGRVLLTQTGTPLVKRSGDDNVDAVIAVVSAAEALRVLPAGLTHDQSLNAAKQALATTYTAAKYEILLDGDGLCQSAEDRISAIRESEADLILLVGGIDHGAASPITDLAQTIALALKTMPAKERPEIIYAGNIDLRTSLADLFGGLTDYTPVDNVLPQFETLNLHHVQTELLTLYHQKRLKKLSGYKTLAQWAANHIPTSAQSFAQTIHYLGQSYNINILGANVGSASTTIAARKQEAHYLTIRSDIGVGNSLQSLLAQTDIECFQRWLPFEMEKTELENFLYNKSLFPQTVPHTYREMLIEAAITREALRLTAAQAKQSWQDDAMTYKNWFSWDLIAGSGYPITQTPFAPLAALTMIDGLEPIGVCSLALDTNSLAEMLGGIAAIAPLAAAQLAGYDTLLKLGVVVAPYGPYRSNETDLKVKMIYSNDNIVETKVPFGSLELLPLGPGEKATVEIRHSGGGIAAAVEGGAVGVIIDNRGRPLRFARNEADRREQIQEWLVSLNLKPAAVSPIIDKAGYDT